MSCIFCRIVEKSLPTHFIFENDHFVAFHDLHPKAPVHALLVPKKHIESLAHQVPEDIDLMGEMMQLLPRIAKQLGLDHGFRTQINTGRGGGQEIFHLHVHILGVSSNSNQES